MGKIKDYEQLEHFDGSEVFVVETESGTKSVPFALLNDRIVDVVEDKSEMLNQTDTELSVESNNAIANSAVAKVLGNGTLIGFAKVDSLEDFEELSSRYPEGIPENAFLILYVTQDLSNTDPDTQFTLPPGLYLLTQQGEVRLCPDTESVNAQFNTVNNLIKDWGVVFASKANVSDLNKVKQDLKEVIANYLEVADILGIWKNATAGRTDFQSLFENSNIKTVPVIDTSSGTNFSRMFYNCVQLETVPLFDTSNATDFLNMFYGCTSLKSIPAFNTAKLTNAFGMVRECTSLVSFKGIDISKVTNCNGIFYGCTSLEEVEIDMSSVTVGNYLFYKCSSLKTVKTLDFSNLSSLSRQFYQCTSLESVEFVPGSIKLSMSMADCSKLDSDSVASIFAGLADLTDSDAQTLTLHANVQITQAQADGAVAKNWNIVGGTVNG